MNSITTAAAFSRRSLLRGGAAFSAGAALGGLPFAPSPAFARSAADWPNLGRMARSYVGAGKVANMVGLFARGEGEGAVVAEGYDTIGRARRADVDSLYRIYSMTKPITGMAAMILIAEGKLGLDQPLAEILPGFANMRVQKQYDGSIGPENLEPARNPILIRHLLTHTAGLGYSVVQQGPLAVKMRERGIVSGQVSRLPVPGLDRGSSVRSLELFAERLAEIPLVYQPGTRWNYSTGLDLMGRVIEVVSGQPFDAFLKERIFDPCGMDSTFFKVPQSEVWRLTTNYTALGRILLPIDPPNASVFALDPPFPMGGSGLVSSPRDYDRFLAMIAGYGMLGGTRVMPEPAVRMGTSDLLPGPETVAGTSIAGMGFGAGARLGWAGGATGYFGWGGAADTVAFVDMTSGLRAGMYTQIMPGTIYPVYDDFEAAVRQDLAYQKGLS